MLQLKEFTYTEPDWTTEQPISLYETNLIVGKNAAGKSLLLHKIILAIRYLLDRHDSDEVKTFCASLCFTDTDNDLFEYQFAFKDGKVEKEYFTKNGNHKSTIIERNEESSILNGSAIFPPSDKLIVNVRRDTIQYPEIEKLLQWAENNIYFSFNELDFFGDNDQKTLYGLNGNLYNMVKSLSPEQLSHAISVIHEIGYPINTIKPVEVESFKKVIFTEKEVNTVLFDKNISKGMFRSIYTILLVEYIASKEFAGMLTIDDFCEGLDYSHSTKLGKFVFNFCKEKNIRLIVSSNDSFLMDVVDMRYWNLLVRNEGAVSSYNYNNSKQLFDDFVFTGLSNFDFFSSDYIHRHKGQIQ